MLLKVRPSFQVNLSLVLANHTIHHLLHRVFLSRTQPSALPPYLYSLELTALVVQKVPPPSNPLLNINSGQNSLPVVCILSSEHFRFHPFHPPDLSAG